MYIPLPPGARLSLVNFDYEDMRDNLVGLIAEVNLVPNEASGYGRQVVGCAVFISGTNTYPLVVSVPLENGEDEIAASADPSADRPGFLLRDDDGIEAGHLTTSLGPAI